MEENNENMQTEQYAKEKRGESRKFLKIYMITFFIVVVSLITLSYFSQEKLNQQIEELALQVDDKHNEAINHMNSAEELQDYLETQEELMEKRENTIQEYKNKMENFELQIENDQAKIDLFDNYIIFLNLFNSENYTECIEIARQIVSSETYLGIKEKILLNEGFLSSEEIMVQQIYEITEHMSENEDIIDKMTANDVKKLQNIQDMR